MEVNNHFLKIPNLPEDVGENSWVVLTAWPLSGISAAAPNDYLAISKVYLSLALVLLTL